MRTPEANRLRAFLLRPLDGAPEAGTALGIGFLKNLQGSIPAGRRPVPSDEMLCLALRDAEEIEISPIGHIAKGEWKPQGLHRPYRLVFRSGLDAGPVTTRQAVLKTTALHHENRRFRESMDPRVTGAEREVLAYQVDRACGFGLVPPTILREIEGVGTGSVQAWVNAPTAWEWLNRGYDYRTDTGNLWLHRLAAFDFITGQIDRHANNFIMDEGRRTYAIDNGYTFPKGDDRRWMRSSVGKHLKGQMIHPQVRAEIQAIAPDAIRRALAEADFQHDEVGGATQRLIELQRSQAWRRLGTLW